MLFMPLTESVLMQTVPGKMAGHPTNKALALLTLKVAHCLHHMQAQPLQLV